MGKVNIWQFNAETLEYERINPFWLYYPLLILIFALIIRFLPFLSVDSFSPAQNKTVKEKATVIEWMHYKAQQTKYDNIERDFQKNN